MRNPIHFFVATALACTLSLPCVAAPVATQLVVNAGSPVTDAQVQGGTFSFGWHFYDANGMEATNTLPGWFIPSFDIVTPGSSVILTDEPFEFQIHSDVGRTLIAFDSAHAGTAIGNVELGVYTSRWSAINSNQVGTVDAVTLANSTPTTFTVVDDDDAAPLATGITLNADIQLTDQQMRAGIWWLDISFWDFSGIVTNIVDGWLPNYSLINPISVTSITENAWEVMASPDGVNYNFSDPVPAIDATNNVTGVWHVVYSALDKDNDRPQDASSATNNSTIFNYTNAFTVIDDDTTPPVPPTGVLTDPASWTNENYFVVTWTSSTDAAGIYEYRLSTNAAKPTHITDGTNFAVAQFALPTAVVISNADFETGTNNLIVPYIPVFTNHWRNISPWNARFEAARWTTNFAQSGSKSMELRVPTWNQANPQGYAVVAQDVYIGNTNSLPVTVDFSGWFRGNMAYTNGLALATAYLKMEFFSAYSDGSSNLIGSADQEWPDNPPTDREPLAGINVLNWTNVTLSTNAPANTHWIRFMCGIAQHWNSVSLTGWWDNLSAQIITATGELTSATFTNQPEGTATNWFFSVDDDDDRPDDRLMSPVTNFITYLDATRPAPVVLTNAVAGPNTNSEITLEWTPLPDGGGNELSPWWTYVVYYTDQARDATNTDPYVSVDGGYTSLGTNTTRSVIVSNLAPDTSYRFSVGGRDRAGNESFLSTTSSIVFLPGFGPFATTLIVNAGADVTDAQILSGNFSVGMHFAHEAGIEATNDQTGWLVPNFDITAPFSGTEILTNEPFEFAIHSDQGRTLIAFDSTHVGTDKSNVEIGTYNITWSAIASNQVSTINSLSLSNGNATTFEVIDDDVDHVALTNFVVAPTAPLKRLWINEVNYDDVGTDSNEWIELMGSAGLSLDDYQIEHINGSDTGLVAAFDLQPASYTFSDETNGWGFFVLGTSATFTVDYIPSNWSDDRLQNDNEGLRLVRKSDGMVVHFFGYEGGTGSPEEDDTTAMNDNNIAQDRTLYLSSGPGADYEDFTWAETSGNASPGMLNVGQTIHAQVVTDQDIALGTYTVTGFVRDASSGVNNNGNDINGPNFSPNYDINNAAHDEIIVDNLFSNAPADGAAMASAEPVSVGPLMPLPGTGTGAVTTIDIGLYTLTLSIEDADDDRLFDAMLRLNETGTVFHVIDDDTDHPYAEDLRINDVVASATNVTDGDLAGGFKLAMTLRDDESGVNATNTSTQWLPNFDILNPIGQQVVSDEGYDIYHGPGVSNLTYTVVTAVESSITIPPANIVEGVYTVRWSGLDRDLDRPGDDLNVIDVPVRGGGSTFAVSDDDAELPAEWTTNEPVRHWIGDSRKGVTGSGSNVISRIQDGELRSLASTNPWRMVFNLRDESGYPRDTVNPATNMHVSIANMAVNNVTNFWLGGSSADTRDANATSVWRWVTPFSYDEVTTIFGANGSTSPVYITTHDLDNDRANDDLHVTNQQVSLLGISDDDNSAPITRTNTPTFTNAALDVFAGGDPDITGYNGTNRWVASADPARVDNRSNQIYIATDGDLADASGIKPLMMKFWVADGPSGLARSTNNTPTNSSVTIGSVIVSNTAGYRSDISATLSRSELIFLGTNYWAFTNFSPAQIESLYGAESNRIVFHALDHDFDRDNDQQRTDFDFGTLVVRDDDNAAPIATKIEVNATNPISDAELRLGGWGLGMNLFDDNGLVTNSSQGGTPPRYGMVSPNGSTLAVNQAWLLTETVDNQLYGFGTAVGGVHYTNILLGTYEIIWSAQDADNDRLNDSHAVTNSRSIQGDSNTFWVYDDDAIAPTEPTNVSVTPTTWTNVNWWNVAYDESRDVSGITHYRLSTNDVMPHSATDGFIIASDFVPTPISENVTNGGFEVGRHGVSIGNWPGFTIYGWSGFKNAPYSYFYYSTNEVYAGTQAVQAVITDNCGSCFPIWTLALQKVWVTNNPSEAPLTVEFRGMFKGDMSHPSSNPTHPTARGVAFLKMEFWRTNAVGGDTLIAFAETQNDTDHNGAPFKGSNVQEWTQAILTLTNVSGEVDYINFGCGMDQQYTDNSYTGHFDNLSASILIGSTNSSGSIVTNVPEGIRTNWLFSVDADNDRINDGMMSAVTNFISYLDITAPAKASITNADFGPDVASEVLLEWDPLPDAGGTELSPWWTYVVYYTDEARDPTNTDPSISMEGGGPAALATNTTRKVIVSNLTSDTEYRFALTGRDRAGNESVLSDPVIFKVGAFVITQGIVFASSGEPLGAEISWKATTNGAGVVMRPYDLLYVDALSFADALTNQWSLVGTVTNTFLVDTGSTTRTPPTQLVSTMRFYRAAQSGKWMITNNNPSASREVYAFKNIDLMPGHNFVSLFMEPDSNGVAFVMGTNLPSGGTSVESTMIEWFDSAQTRQVTNSVWLSDSGHWMWDVGGSGMADHKPIPMVQGFNVFIPPTEPNQRLMVIGRVPSNDIVQMVEASGLGPIFNVLSCPTPRRMMISELNFEGSGFTGGSTRRDSDEIRILAKGVGPYGSPRLRAWFDTDDHTWKNYVTGGSAMYEYVEPDEAIILYTRASSSPFAWTNKLHYTPPTTGMNP